MVSFFMPHPLIRVYFELLDTYFEPLRHTYSGSKTYSYTWIQCTVLYPVFDTIEIEWSIFSQDVGAHL